MSITNAIPTAWKLDLLDRCSGDTFKVALYGPSATLDESTPAFTASGEVTGTNWPSGGIVLSGFLAEQVGSGAALSFDDLVEPHVTIAGAVGYMVYNASRANVAVRVGLFTNGTLAATDGDVTIDFPPSGASALFGIA